MINYVVHYRGDGGLIRSWVVRDRYLQNSLKWIDEKGFDLIGYEVLY